MKRNVAFIVVTTLGVAASAFAADVTRKSVESNPATLQQAPAIPSIRVIDAFVVAVHGRTLAILDEQERQRAEALVQGEYARMHRRDIDLTQIEKDAQEAIKLHDNYPGAHFLLGYVRYEEGKHARSRYDVKSEEQKMQEAHVAYSKAIDLLMQRKVDAFGELPAFYMYRINAAVALAYIVPKVADRSRLLENAVADAKNAIQRGPRNPDRAYAAMGNALESLAWLVEGKAAQFAEAVDAFENARKKNPKNVRYWIALGRCKCRAMEESIYLPQPKFANYGKDAEEKLKTVLAGNGQAFERALTEDEKSEALYWLARVYFLQDRFTEAETTYRDCINVANVRSPWLPLAWESVASTTLTQAAKRNQPEAPETLLNLQSAREAALALSDYDPSEAARIRGRALIVEGKCLQALDTYNQQLAKQNQVPTTLSDIRLFIDKHNLVLDVKCREEFRKEKKIDAETIARETEMVAAKASGLLGLRGQAFANAGLAQIEWLRDKDELAIHRKAVEQLRKAVQFLPPNDPALERCRAELKRHEEELKKKEAEQKREDKKQNHAWSLPFVTPLNW